MYLFINDLFSPETRFHYLAWVVICVISIVLHELAHGYTAIKLGDRTPLNYNRMNLNPLTHMGPYSIFTLLVFGIAWGAMPIDPSRMKGKYAEAKVAAAGPLTNLSIAFISLLVFLCLLRFANLDMENPMHRNLNNFFLYAMHANVFLFLFNMLPVPPLDGASVLANLHRGYARLLHDPAQGGLWFIAFIFGAGVTWYLSAFVSSAILAGFIIAVSFTV